MTAAIGAELMVAVKPALEGVTSIFGEAGKLGGVAMGVMAGRHMGKHIGDAAKEAGKAAGDDAGKEFGQAFAGAVNVGAALNTIAGQSTDAFKGLGGKLGMMVIQQFDETVSGKKLNLAELISPFTEMENAVSNSVFAITD